MWLGPSLIEFGTPLAFATSSIAVLRNGFNEFAKAALLISAFELFILASMYGWSLIR